MSRIAERNSAAKRYVSNKINAAKTKVESDFSEFDKTTEVYQLLTDLIEVKSKGFRGIVTTALVGIHLDINYNPLKDFYGCNPRPLFENAIWYALQENEIPCGKSDPLNVAKNARQLDKSWADGKRPQKAALAVVKFLELVVATDRHTKLIDYFFFRLWKYAQSLSAVELVLIDPDQISKLELGSKIVEFTLIYPESGQLPQFLVSQLLMATFRNSTTKVVGGEESVFGTNTTSRKPADVWLEEQNVPTNLYEITVKKISFKRLDDSIDAIKATGHVNCSVTFICRLPRDASDLHLVNNCVAYKGKYFEFIDYQSFCLSLFALLSKGEITSLLLKTSEVVGSIQTSMKTKAGWNKLFGLEHN